MCINRRLLLTLFQLVVISGLIRGGLAATAGDNLAHGGAGTLIFTGRSQLEGQSVASHINRKHPRTKITFIASDTSKLASVYEAAKTIKELSVQIDGIIGIPTVVAGPWEITEDGVESHFQRNYLCFFVFVTQLMEALNPGSRVVLMTTSVRQEVPAPKWDNVNFSVSPSIPHLSILRACHNNYARMLEWRVLSPSRCVYIVRICEYHVRQISCTEIPIHQDILCESWK